MSRWDDTLAASAALHARLKNLSDIIRITGDIIADALSAGKTVLACGNGGSASQASHFITELVGRYLKERASLPGICLNSDGALLTCLVNDYDPADVFKRQVEGLGKPGDILVGLSTSGHSENVRRALVAGKENGLTTISMIGKDGGTIKGVSDYDIWVPDPSTARVQETHLMIIHTWCDLIDERF